MTSYVMVSMKEVLLLESHPSGGGNFVGVLFIIMLFIGLGIAASSTVDVPSAAVIVPTAQPVVILPETGLAQPGELQAPVFSGTVGTDLTAGTTLQDCVVQSGDTLGIIAARHGITLQELLAVNPQVTDPNRIYPGQVLRLPHNAVADASSGQPVPGELAQPVPGALPVPGELAVEPILPSTGGGTIYTVQPGDFLSGIAVRYNKSVAEILLANPGLTNPDVLTPGQQIVIPD
jgi:LysM repeat protein